MADEEIQRTFWVKRKLWNLFLKQSIDMGKSCNERINKFMEDEVRFNKVLRGDKNDLG